MKNPTEQELKEFVNALQLSISTKINDIRSAENCVKIIFGAMPEQTDVNLYNFLKLFECEWMGDENCVVLYSTNKFNWPKLTLFLLLTRMNGENISKLAELDEVALEISEKMGFKSSHASIKSVKMCSQAVFQKMEVKKMTIRELAEKTGLTQVSISNFKAGKDIRLSNFINIINAMGMGLKIK